MQFKAHIIIYNNPVFSFFTVCWPGPFFCCTTVQSDEQCNIKRALADKKRKKKEEWKKSNLHPSPKLSSSPTLSSSKFHEWYNRCNEL